MNNEMNKVQEGYNMKDFQPHSYVLLLMLQKISPGSASMTGHLKVKMPTYNLNLTPKLRFFNPFCLFTFYNHFLTFIALE